VYITGPGAKRGMESGISVVLYCMSNTASNGDVRISGAGLKYIGFISTSIFSDFLQPAKMDYLKNVACQ
jgi:hypothetical protein